VRRVVSLLVAFACVVTAAGPVWAQQRLFVLASKELVEVDPSAAGLGRIIRRVPTPFVLPDGTGPIPVAGGTKLVWTAGDGVGVYDTRSNDFRWQALPGVAGQLVGASADGFTLMFWGARPDAPLTFHGQLSALNVRDGSVRTVDLGTNVTNVVYAPVGDLLFVEKSFEPPASYVEVKRAGDGSLVRTIPLESRELFSLSVDSGGSRLFAYATDGVFVYDVASGALLARTPGDDGVYAVRMTVDEHRRRLLVSAGIERQSFLMALADDTLQPLGSVPLASMAPYASGVLLDVSPVSATLFALQTSFVPTRTGPDDCRSSALIAMDVDTGRVRRVADLSTVTGTVDCQVSMVRLTEPKAPAGLAAQVAGNRAELVWTPVMATSYELEAGTAPGLSNIGRFTMTENRLTVDGVPPGTYYVRVRGVNVLGKGSASQDVRVVVP